ncbi:hypothetical protein GHT06_008757 [Daphnia sinensis]|uniref:Uncharacterized protein n=1 Tax=Daphnia sinensis TaxID=1820382 RepID=A0AAD5LLP9_9CRUS|nr:hypothetical protein GHT06_008757 [Daphnia sinensis]
MSDSINKNLLLCDVLVSAGEMNLPLPADGLSGDSNHHLCKTYQILCLCVGSVGLSIHLFTTEDSQGNLSLLIRVSIKTLNKDHSFLVHVMLIPRFWSALKRRIALPADDNDTPICVGHSLRHWRGDDPSLSAR